MRNINVTKYRKLLYNLQYFCCKAKWMLNMKMYHKLLTDYERGMIAGKHSAYNDVLRELHKMIEYANEDWNYVKLREEEWYVD